MCRTVRELTDSAEGLRQRPRDDRDPGLIGRELESLRHLMDLLELEFAATAAEVEAIEGYARDGAESASEWIRHECHLSKIAASRAVDVGEQMHRLPESTDA